ncbi:cytochrome P450 [Acinetobacter shaoyimingii]|uniref:cytochrome P450 n=1 Tax=Acinetobacter shaoyimingii TaxID=2715164 RepID=UPI001D0EE0F7|nr:cytochrome P450 [Acinetobacter shaoyimingii]
MFQITVTGDELQLFLGEQIGGAKVVEIKDVSPEFVTPQELALKYGISEDTVRAKLASINQGVGKKCKYKPDEAHLILSQKAKKAGRGRIN